jgi:hypothetical protein
LQPADRVALGLLTRGRPQAAIACIQSALATAGEPIEAFVLIDDDPPAADAIASHFEGNPLVHTRTLPLRHYYVRGMNALGRWLDAVGADHFVVTNDDVTFLQPGWAALMRKELAGTYPDGMGIMELAGPELCAHYASRLDFFHEYFDGLLAEPAYTFYCSDTELRECARSLGRYSWWYGPDILHHHVTADTLRHEVSYWLPFDRAEYVRRWQPGWLREVWMP